jgi:hypothetical protein
LPAGPLKLIMTKAQGRHSPGLSLIRSQPASSDGDYDTERDLTSPMTPVSIRQALPEGKALLRPYSAVPHDILRDRRLIPTDIALVAALLVYARAAASCWPSVATLQADIGRGRRATQMSLRRLKDAGWIAERTADNATGRMLILVWRQGAQKTAPGGRNPSPCRGAQLSAQEWKKQIEEKFAAPSEGKRADPPRPATREDLLELHNLSGWINRPPGDPLRRIVERRLAAMDGRPQEAPKDALPVYITGRTPDTRRRHGGPARGPRPLFG